MENVRLRKANEKDIRFLFELSNDELVRKNSFHSISIKWDEHLQWFYNQVQSSDKELYILEINDILVGQGRIKYIDNIGVISYSIHAKYRGKGYGNLLIKLLEKEGYKRVFCLVAYVKRENGSSINVFKSNGYKVDEISNGYKFSKIAY